MNAYQLDVVGNIKLTAPCFRAIVKVCSSLCSLSLRCVKLDITKDSTVDMTVM